MKHDAINSNSSDTLDAITIVRRNRTAAVLGMSRVTMWRRQRDDPDFPRPVRVSPGIDGFTLSDIKAYIEKKRSVR